MLVSSRWSRKQRAANRMFCLPVRRRPALAEAVFLFVSVRLRQRASPSCADPLDR